MHNNEQGFSFTQFISSLTTKKVIAIFGIVGFIVFGNALFNSFVWDDFPFIINDPDISKFNIVHLFGQNIYTDAGFYRPVHALYNALLYAFFGTHAFFYHFLQIGLHILSAILVYFLLRYILSRGNAKDISDKELQHLSGSQRVKYLRMHSHDSTIKGGEYSNCKN